MMSRSNEMDSACEGEYDRSSLSLRDDVQQPNALHGRKHFVLSLPFNYEGKKICIPLTFTERFRILYFHDGFGIGPHLYSLSLLPGEKRTLETIRSTKTSLSSEEETSDTHELATEMASALTSEQQSRTGSSSSHEFGVDVHAEADFGFVSGSVDTNYKGQWASSREDFSKMVSSSSQKAASSISAKRSLVMREATEIAVEEKTIRVIENFNRAHPVDYHFFQLLRRFRSILETYDIRVMLGWPNIAVGLIPASQNVRAMSSQASGVFFPTFDLRKEAYTATLRDTGKGVVERIPFITSTRFVKKIETKYPSVKAPYQLIGIKKDALKKHLQLNRNLTNASAISEDCLPDFYFGVPYYVDEFRLCIETLSRRKPELANFVALALEKVDEYLNNLFEQYQSDLPAEKRGLPVQIPQNEVVVATNGVHAEAMLGVCSAAEAYVRAQRDIELEKSDIELSLLQERKKREELINKLIEDGTIKPDTCGTLSLEKGKLRIEIKLVGNDSDQEDSEV